MAHMCSDRAGWSSHDNPGILDQVSVDMYVIYMAAFTRGGEVRGGGGGGGGECLPLDIQKVNRDMLDAPSPISFWKTSFSILLPSHIFFTHL